MRIDVLTLFPPIFESPLALSIVKRAQDTGLVDINLTDIRDFTTDSYRKVDDKPYGGGPGMVMIPGPVFDAFDQAARLVVCLADTHDLVQRRAGRNVERGLLNDLIARIEFGHDKVTGGAER